MRIKEGREYVQCAGDAYDKPWQEVRRVLITSAQKRGDTVMAKAYRRAGNGDWLDYIGEHSISKDTLQGPWEDYVAYLEEQGDLAAPEGMDRVWRTDLSEYAARCVHGLLHPLKNSYDSLIPHACDGCCRKGQA
jgi:hypothetical protein